MKTVQVGPIPYTLRFESVPKSDLIETCKTFYGRSDHGARTLTVDCDMGIEDQAVTLLHEVIHAACSVNHIPLKEREVHQLAVVLSSAVKVIVQDTDNPNFNGVEE